MWISLFAVVLAIALGCGLGAVIMELDGNNDQRYAAKRVVRGRR